MFKKYVLPLMLVLSFTSVAFAGMTEQERRLQALEKQAGVSAELLEVLERFTWGGDFRLRYQHDDVQAGTTNTLDRDRYRLRFRLDGNVHLQKNLDLGFRIETGGTGAVKSGNQTLDGGFNHKDFDLSRVFIKWTPGDFKVEAGKFAVPFMHSNLLWDSDVNVEGVSEQYSTKMGKTKLDLVLGQFVVDEFSGGEDITLIAYQGIVEQKTSLGKFKASVAYYDYRNHEDPETDASNSNSKSATSPSGPDTGSAVKVLDIMGQWSEKINGKKLTLSAEYATNTGDLLAGQADLDTAWNVGANYGKAGKKCGDWQLGMFYRVVQNEAVFEQFADSDINNGANNFRGFKVYGAMGISKGIKLKVAYYDTQEERGAKNERETLQTDLIFKF
jgi:hypothetical protein